ncbi:hypothetical protein [Streptomyces stelliscabiei]|uniref:Uncharacterized protein n=3 Tax=Streptomyces stelliscabiei TaxID=146820 RepID=A0A8I0P112_9ACTN|nr:hypothetical protein [Streptomyces stelliscabiei]MBE1596230.1 hypothetical protein [Streptomyces stelliscabiei]MDX2518045.1 hypothetical protein [Streptomyces stelliscabiei]
MSTASRTTATPAAPPARSWPGLLVVVCAQMLIWLDTPLGRRRPAVDPGLRHGSGRRTGHGRDDARGAAATAGAGSAVNSVTRQVGGTLGVAMAGSILAGVYRHRTADAELPGAARGPSPAAEEQARASAEAARSLPLPLPLP